MEKLPSSCVLALRLLPENRLASFNMDTWITECLKGCITTKCITVTVTRIYLLFLSSPVGAEYHWKYHI